MDMQGLSQLFQSPNWSLWGQGQDAFNTEQEKARADLASVLQQTDEKRQMLPLRMDTERSIAGLNNASARNTNATAQKSEIDNQSLLATPEALRAQAKMAEMYSTISKGDIDKVKSQMTQAQKWGSLAQSQGGKLSTEQMLQLSQESPGLLNYFKQAGGINALAGMVTAFNKLDADRQKSDSAHQITANATVAAAEKHRQGVVEAANISANVNKLKYGETYNDQLLRQKNPIQYYVKERTRLAQEISGMPSDDPQRQGAIQLYDFYMDQENAERKAAYEKSMGAAVVNAGKSPSMDALGNAQGIKAVPVTPQTTATDFLRQGRPAPNPAPSAQPTPRARQDQAQNVERVIIYKNGQAVGTIPKAQVDAAKAQGYTIK